MGEGGWQVRMTDEDHIIDATDIRAAEDRAAVASIDVNPLGNSINEEEEYKQSDSGSQQSSSSETSVSTTSSSLIPIAMPTRPTPSLQRSGTMNLPSLHSDFLIHTQLGTLQYCLVKPLMAILTFALTLLDVYGDGGFEMDRGYPYVTFITNMSQIWAM